MELADARSGEATPKIARRLGSTPQERGSSQGMSCPDVFELASGDIAVIVTDQTSEFDPELLDLSASRAEYERTVVIPRELLLAAMRQLSQEAWSGCSRFGHRRIDRRMKYLVSQLSEVPLRRAGYEQLFSDAS